MKTYASHPAFFLLFLSVWFIACEPDDEAITPNAGTVFEGNYKMNSYEVHIYEDAVAIDTITVIKRPVITLKADSIQANALRIDPLEFMEVTAPVYDNPNHRQSIRIKNADDATLVKVNGRKFEIKSMRYDWIITDGIQTWVWPFDFNARGEFDQAKVSLQFEITHHDGNSLFTWKGKATGERVK